MSVQIELDGRGLRLRWPGVAAIGEISAVVEVAGEPRHESGDWTREGDAFAATAGPVTLTLRATREGAAATIAITARASADAAVTLLGVSGDADVQGAPPGWWIHNGYQSWDPADVAAIGGKTLPTSWWTVGLANREGVGIAGAAVTAERLAARFDCSDGRLVASQGVPRGDAGPAWTARAGDELELEPLRFVAHADAWQALRLAAGDHAPAGMGTTASEARPGPPVPIGWLSWYHYGPWVSEEDVIENCRVITDGALHGLGYRYVQVDDGWQQAWGDWVPNTKFRNGLGEVAAILGAEGHVAGIWTAPFLVSASADLSTDAPESWFIQDPATGQRLIDPEHVVFGPMHVLDARNPEVVSHLERTFARLYADGMRYFKIDFLYAGAYAGLPAFNRAIAAIRSGIKDSYLLGCGAPLLPLAGRVEGCRVGQDTATPMYDFEAGKPMARIFGDEVLWIARNVACRNHLAGWFQLDPDVALVGANLSLGQARQLVSVVALSGGPFFASDALPELDSARLALLTNQEVLALVGGPPAVPDWEPGTDQLAAIWRRPDGVLGAFNWSGPPRRLMVERDASTRGRDLWAGADLQASNGVLELELEESGVRLLRFEGGGRLRAWLE